MTTAEWLRREIEQRREAGRTDPSITPGDLERMYRDCGRLEVEAAINQAVKEFHDCIDDDLKMIDATIADTALDLGGGNEASGQLVAS